MYIGIDLGTTSVKTILTNNEGKVLKEATKHYPLLIPKPNWTEQDPNLWYEKTIEALKELVVGYEEKIKAISFSGQMHGMVILDEYDNVIRNALLWNDQRTYKEVDYLNNVIGKDKIIENTGNIAVTGLTAPKVMWIYNNEPENFKKINKVMLPKDYLVYKLSNEFATDLSDVSGTLYFDVKNKKYSKFMLDILKLKEKQLPKVYSSYDVVGYLTKDLKKLLNITNDVKIVAGGGDQAVGAIGVGIVDDNIMNISLGTSGVVFKPLKEFAVDLKTNMQVYVHANDQYHIMGVMLNAAGSLKWWVEDVLESKDYNQIFSEIKDLDINDTLYFLPYLTGERAPVNNPNAEGVFLGLRADHKKMHLSQADIEGISFNLRQIYENINTKF
jgi:xylulokinase